MKAILMKDYGDVDVLNYEEVDAPLPKDDEVLIQVHAAGLNFADVMMRKGVYVIKPETPFVPGIEVAGAIVELGANVTRLQVGQNVVAFLTGGGYAEFAVANVNQVFVMPENLDAGTALALTVQGWTAMGLLREVQVGQTILVHAAAGGVGSFLVQLAKLRGAKVIGTTSTPEKLRIVEELGADFAVNYSTTNWTQKVMQATNEQGANLIIDSVGGEIGLKSLACLARNGSLVIYGQASNKGFPISSTDLFFKNQTIKGYLIREETPQDFARYTKDLLAAHDNGQLKIKITEFPLEQASIAQTVLEMRQTTGKVILKT